jgi:hypothetical protein
MRQKHPFHSIDALLGLGYRFEVSFISDSWREQRKTTFSQTLIAFSISLHSPQADIVGSMQDAMLSRLFFEMFFERERFL